MILSNGIPTGSLNYEQHYKNIFKEARRLSKFQHFDKNDDKVKEKNSILSKSIPRSEYMTRINTLVTNFVSKDGAVLISMSNRLHAECPSEELVSIMSKIKSFNKDLYMATGGTSSSSDPNAHPGDMGATLENAEEYLTKYFDAMEHVFIGDVEAWLQNPSYKKQCDKIDKLLANQNVSDDEGEAVPPAVQRTFAYPGPSGPSPLRSARDTQSSPRPATARAAPPRPLSARGPNQPASQTQRNYPLSARNPGPSSSVGKTAPMSARTTRRSSLTQQTGQRPPGAHGTHPNNGSQTARTTKRWAM
eukprot:NODE_5215_length_1048_cov_33.015135_g4655_i0.p1 GENE.NODE_5215_length_1048_cov_33.015135_g4655_i0~~NODE_5215_length_1048_cov_33.015135_g4655_i0.p1  ORF type:complete len:304 (-),score=52.32 NODE_5215_length_1048_cov_33.015135_g4655_i0:81-992(-)